jgi:hypothetical protein
LKPLKTNKQKTKLERRHLGLLILGAGASISLVVISVQLISVQLEGL